LADTIAYKHEQDGGQDNQLCSSKDRLCCETKFSQQCLCRILSSGISYDVVW